MNKWKCDICKKEFDNFHAQGFDNKIYCPLCFFKEETRRLKQKVNQLETNWNELKEWLENTLENEKYCHFSENTEDRCRYNVFEEVLNKTKELKSDSNE